MYRLKKHNVIKETESAAKRDFLLGQGYAVIKETRTGMVDVDGVMEKWSEAWTVSMLKSYAEENGIDISGLKGKKEIMDAIHTAEEESDENNGREAGAAG